ncbi:hypothetical protein ACIPM0_22155 [Pseudomonas sichuanensis]
MTDWTAGITGFGNGDGEQDVYAQSVVATPAPQLDYQGNMLRYGW